MLIQKANEAFAQAQMCLENNKRLKLALTDQQSLLLDATTADAVAMHKHRIKQCVQQIQANKTERQRLQILGQLLQSHADTFIHPDVHILFWLKDYAGATCKRDDNGKIAYRADSFHEALHTEDNLIGKCRDMLGMINLLASTREKILRPRSTTTNRAEIESLRQSTQAQCNHNSQWVAEFWKTLPGKEQSIDEIEAHLDTFIHSFASLPGVITDFCDFIQKNEALFASGATNTCIRKINNAMGIGYEEMQKLDRVINGQVEVQSLVSNKV